MRKTFRIHIKAETESEVKEELKELAYLATGMREWQKKWKEDFGYANKENMKAWEKKMDEWIEKHKIFYDAD